MISLFHDLVRHRGPVWAAGFLVAAPARAQDCTAFSGFAGCDEAP